QSVFIAQVKVLLEAPPGVGCKSLVHPCQVLSIGHAVERTSAGCRQKDEFDTIVDNAHGSDRFYDRSGDIDERLIVARVGGVEINEFAYAVGSAVCDAGDDHAAITVSNKDHVREVPVVEQLCDIVDVHVEVHRRRDKVRMFSKPCQRRRKHLVSSALQPLLHLRIAPSSVAATGYEYVG